MNQDSPPVARLAPVTARGQKARSRLLRAAEHVFGQRGYEGASIAEICRRAQSALGSFYVYFPDKKAAFVELVDSLGSRLRRELVEGTEGVTGRFAIERAGLRVFFDFASRHRQLYRIVRQAEFVDQEAFHRYYRRFAEGYQTGLTRSMAAGEIRQMDTEVLAYCLMGISDFLGLRWVLWAKKGEDTENGIDRVIDEAMSFVRAGIAPVSDAATATNGAKRANGTNGHAAVGGKSASSGKAKKATQSAARRRPTSESSKGASRARR